MFIKLIVSFVVTFQVPDSVKWIKINSGQNGYYRVLYDDSNWNNIIDDLRKNHKSFSTKVGFMKMFDLIYKTILFSTGSHRSFVRCIYSMSRQST